MSRASFGRQFLALMKRNFILKKRSKSQTIQEIFFPIYYVAILAIIRLAASPSRSPAVNYYNEYSIDNHTYYPDSTKQLLITPNTTEIISVITVALGILAQDNNNGTIFVPTYSLYDTVNETEAVYKANESNYQMGIEFTDGTLNELEYTIRLPKSSIPSTDNALYGSQGSCRDGDIITPGCPGYRYLTSGFINMQKALDTALIRRKVGQNVSAASIKVQQFAKDSWLPNVDYLQILASIYFVFAYSPFVNFMVVNLVNEKEKKIKEGMRMMGMRDSAFWASWGATYGIIITVVTCAIILIVWASKFLQHSNFFLFFVILLEYGLTILSLSFIVSVFFTKAEKAGGLASLATMILSLLYLPVSLTRSYGPDGPVSSIPVGGQWALCLFSPTALALAVDQAVYMDIVGVGLNWDTLAYGQFPLYNSMIMLFVDFILYGLIAIYLDNVVPSEYGQRRPFNFFLLPSYWFPKKIQQTYEVDQGPINYSNGQAQDHASVTIAVDNRQIPSELEEPVSEELHGKEYIRIKNIKKVFKTKVENKSEVVAVDGISLDLYEGHITCLLGHNGAGKTTLINMLTGMTPSTSGSASVYGYNVSDTNEMNTIRGMTGVCPQHNILLDTLTCAEHLQFFGSLRGIPRKRLQDEITQSLKDVDMTDQMDTLAAKLSGGQKRKLCVAIALIGDPKVIFLDEPTAGMDPYSRRHLWSLLKERRHNKVILLTTHFMDEADILADRKAFISKGKLQCVGSSLFLKNRFGVGYHLNMVVDSPKSDNILLTISQHIPEVQFERIHGKELHFTLPLSSLGQFSVLFKDLDRRSAELGVTSYGVSMTTLEEVFLKLELEEESTENEVTDLNSEDQDKPLISNRNRQKSVLNQANVTLSLSRDNSVSPEPQKKFTDEEAGSENDSSYDDPKNRASNKNSTQYGEQSQSIPQMEYIDDKDLKSQQFWALITAKIKYTRRNKLVLIFRVVMPILFMIIGSAVQKFTASSSPSPTADLTLNLEADLYVRTYTPEASNNPNMTYNVSSSSGDNASDFINSLSTQNLGITNITGLSVPTLFGFAPHHVGVTIYDITANGADRSTDVYNLTAMFNDTAQHSLPVIINIISNSILRMSDASSSSVTNITTHVKPWPFEPTLQLQFNNGLLSSVILIGLAMALIPSGFGIATVRERETKVRGLMRISGVTMNMYWASTFVFDYVQYLAAGTASVVILYAFQVDALLYWGAAIALILLYLLYMPVMIFLAYSMAFAFDKMDKAATVMSNVFTFISFLPYMAVAILDMAQQYNVAKILHYILTLIDPPYAVFGGLYYIFRVHLVESILQLTNSPNIPFEKYFEWGSLIPITLIAPIFHAFWLFFLIRFLEVRKTGGAIKDVFCFGSGDRYQAVPSENKDIDENEDEDVTTERKVVRELNKNAGNDIQDVPVLMVENLRKEFKKGTNSCDWTKKKEDKVKVAVRNNTFCVKAGEVFGLLGPNGAGKTTALNMIIAEEGATKGQVIVGGHNITSSLSDAFQAMGYCPQHDAVIDDLTLREHLVMYSHIRGITKDDTQKLVQYFLDSLQVQEHADKIAKKLSGGTKRKLSYAISMIGEAQVVLMDEPSTGMDPKSKRFMWDTISAAFSDSSRGAILTTHYMEEADALCSRVAIMVNGQIECIGSTQHLKNKYGSGYLLEIKLDQKTRQGQSAEECDTQMKAVDDYIKQTFRNPVLAESFGDRATYSVPQNNVDSLGDVFTALEQAKRQFNIEEYSFSQSTLEQVFLEFAKHQLEENDDEKTDTENKAFGKKKSLMRQQSVQSGENTKM